MKKDIIKNLITDSINSNYEQIVKRDLELFDINKVHIITGPRRSGKTFFLFSQIEKLRKKIPRENIFYINFDDERLFPFELKDLQWITEAYYELFPAKKNETVYAFFDEVQEVKLWEKFIRRIYDAENIRIFISGSSSKLFYSEINTSLRGRTLTYKLFPLSFNEFLRFNVIDTDYLYSKTRAKILDAFNHFMIFGGFPETVNIQNQVILKILKEYLDLTIYKDLIERYKISNHTILKYLISICFRNVSTLFSINKTYNDLKSTGLIVAKNTLYDYMSFLEDASLVFQVPVYSHSVKEQQRNPKKIYIIDNGYHSLVSVKRDFGKLFENIVFLHLKRVIDEIFYYKGKQEVDFCYKNSQGELQLINVSYDISTPETFKREITGLKEAMMKFSVKQGTLINAEVEEKIDTDSGIINIIPLWKWLLE